MEQSKRPKILRGEVVSDRMQKTAVVLVRRYQKVPKYGKYVKISKRFKAHDENKEYQVGDRVEIQEVRPLSRDKRWKIIKLIERPTKVGFESKEMLEGGGDKAEAKL